MGESRGPRGHGLALGWITVGAFSKHTLGRVPQHLPILMCSQPLLPPTKKSPPNFQHVEGESLMARLEMLVGTLGCCFIFTLVVGWVNKIRSSFSKSSWERKRESPPSSHSGRGSADQGKMPASLQSACTPACGRCFSEAADSPH